MYWVNSFIKITLKCYLEQQSISFAKDSNKPFQMNWYSSAVAKYTSVLFYDFEHKVIYAWFDTKYNEFREFCRYVIIYTLIKCVPPVCKQCLSTPRVFSCRNPSSEPYTCIMNSMICYNNVSRELAFCVYLHRMSFLYPM